MPTITVSTWIDAGVDVVWTALADIASHVEWMADAEAIRFTSPASGGVGTTFECDTKVGPLRLTDVMEVTLWEPGRRLGVRHVGLVAGEGAFTLSTARGGGTDLHWRERLVFPWWAGGPVGALVGGRVLERIWKGNLGRFRARLEEGAR